MATTKLDELDDLDEVPMPLNKNTALARARSKYGLMALTSPSVTLGDSEIGPLAQGNVQAVCSAKVNECDSMVAFVDRISKERSKIGGQIKDLVGSLLNGDDGLDKVVNYLNDLHREGVESTLLFAYSLGLALIRLKKILKGHFVSVVNESCEFSYSTASSCMRLVKRWDKLLEKCDENLQDVVTLSYTEALAMIAEPRQKPGTAELDAPLILEDRDVTEPAAHAVDAEDVPADEDGSALLTAIRKQSAVEDTTGLDQPPVSDRSPLGGVLF